MAWSNERRVGKIDGARADDLTPQLVTAWREGYDAAKLRADALAGLTVAIVAIPLSMAIAISSGLSPDKGLFTAIIGGFLISALGGSRFQIGGPAGAFIVLVYAIVERHGYDGLVVATLMAGVMLAVMGWLRLGTYIKYIPFPVTVGFTAGIAVIIFASQIRELLGLDMAKEPAALIPKIEAIWRAIGSIKPTAIGLSLLALGLIIGLRRWRPRWPGLLVAVGVCAALTAMLGLQVATIGSRFGGLPSSLPWPQMPAIDLARMQAVLPDAIAIALLGAIESLLSAVVADGMTGDRHRSNCELVAQGVGNIGAVAFAGMCVTGTIARTATNVRSGATGPVAGILHALFILVFMLVAGPLAAHIPLASLAAVLAVVAWNMAEKDEIATLLRTSRGDAVILVVTFLLTILVDLVVAIGVGVTLGAFMFLHRMAEAVAVETGKPLIRGAALPGQSPSGAPDAGASDAEEGVFVYRISGAFFFGATAAVTRVLDRIGERPRLIVLDFSEVPLVDSTAANSLHGIAEKLTSHGTRVAISGADKVVRRSLLQAGLRRPLVHYASTVEEAVEQWRRVDRPGAAIA